MTFIDNESELLAEHQAQKEAAEAARKMEQEKKWEEQRVKAREAEAIARASRIKAHSFIFEAIAHEISRRPHWECQHDGELRLTITSQGFTLNKDYLPLHVENRQERLSAWRSRETSQLQVTIGSYGERKTYPQKKDGSFSYDKIADRVCEWAQGKIETAKTERGKQNNSGRTSEWLASHPGIKEYYGAMRVSPSSVDGSPLFVKIEISRAMDEETATALYDFLVARGFVKKEG